MAHTISKFTAPLTHDPNHPHICVALLLQLHHTKYGKSADLVYKQYSRRKMK
jgi:hypothetical protein